MRFGMHLPQWGSIATRDGVLGIARVAEEVGFHSVWVGDHVAWPARWESSYPFAAAPPVTPDQGFLEAFTVLAAVAGATERVRLGIGALVLPLRHPLMVAKVAATLDVVSGGRAELALGAGWLREEFEVLGEPFDGRGARFDAAIDLLRHAWAHGHVEGSGPEYHFDEAIIRPLPAQSGGPPLLIAGMTRAAFRRAASLGDGWYAVGAKVEELSDGRAQIEAERQRLGRTGPFTVATVIRLDPDRERLRHRLGALAEAGVDKVVFGTFGDDLNKLSAAVEDFGTHVLPDLTD